MTAVDVRGQPRIGESRPQSPPEILAAQEQRLHDARPVPEQVRPTALVHRLGVGAAHDVTQPGREPGGVPVEAEHRLDQTVGASVDLGRQVAELLDPPVTGKAGQLGQQRGVREAACALQRIHHPERG